MGLEKKKKKRRGTVMGEMKIEKKMKSQRKNKRQRQSMMRDRRKEHEGLKVRAIREKVSAVLCVRNRKVLL